jgi:nucleoside-diphosphate-sugar epimerase
MTVLVVGGSGFLGQAVAQALNARDTQAIALSRSGHTKSGRGIVGNATLPTLGLDAASASELKASVTHIVSCFGSVDWSAGPRQALDLHLAGTRQVLDFAADCPHLQRLVHVSSVLALGRATGTISNRELSVGQTFRNWYEYGKHVAECEVRREQRFPWRVLRLGPILGLLDGIAPSPAHGLQAAVPFLVRGYPAHLAERGNFPCYVTDVHRAAAVTAQALYADDAGHTWTWFDPLLPSLAEVLTSLCAAWNVVPRIVDLPWLAHLTRLTARQTGLPTALHEYAEPWVDIDADVVSQLATTTPASRDDYLLLTGEAMRTQRSTAFA